MRGRQGGGGLGPGQSLLVVSCGGSDQGEEDVVVPCRAFELSGHGVLSGFSPCDVEGEASHQGEVLGSVVLSVSLSVLVHGHVEDPVEAVFDGPMGAHDMLEAVGRERGAHDAVAGFGFGLPWGFARCLDLAEGGQAGPAMRPRGRPWRGASRCARDRRQPVDMTGVRPPGRDRPDTAAYPHEAFALLWLV